MLQNADNDQYTRSEAYSQTYNYSSGASINPKDIPGYTYVRRTDSGRTTTFYYDRDKYKIDYYYGGELLDTISNVKFDANINKAPYVWTPTAAQCGVDSDYSFAGWYSDSGLTTPYTFSKMPAHNEVLYAKWTAPNFTVRFLDDDGVTQLADDQTVEKYKKVTVPTPPTKSGYTFDGWYTAASGGELYDWETQITEDTTIYAHWTQNLLSYVVHYYEKDTTTTVASDKTVTNPNFTIGQTVTEQAIAVTGYRPLKLEDSIELAADGNQIIFYYEKKSDTTSYTVRYILDPAEYPGNITVAADKTVADVPGDTASVVELAAAVDYAALYASHPELAGEEFFPDAVEKTLVLTADESANVLTFLYSSFKSAHITVNFVDMDGNEIADPDKQILKVSKTFTLSRTPIAGWELNKAVVGTAYDGDPAADSYRIDEGTAGTGLTFTLYYQKKATITVVSRSKLYDGTALVLPENLEDLVAIEGLLDDDSVTSLGFNYANADYPESAAQKT